MNLCVDGCFSFLGDTALFFEWWVSLQVPKLCGYCRYFVCFLLLLMGIRSCISGELMGEALKAAEANTIIIGAIVTGIAR